MKTIDTGLKLLALMKKFGVRHQSSNASKYDDRTSYHSTIPKYGAALRELKALGFVVTREMRDVYYAWGDDEPTKKEQVITAKNEHGCEVQFRPRGKCCSVNIYGPKKAKYLYWHPGM